MDISSIAAAATQMSQERTGQSIQMAVLKKVMDVQEQSALQLIQALGNSAPSNPPNLGISVDTTA
jgi:hypothetical protein